MLPYIKKISNSVGRNDNFLAKARKLPILQSSLDTFDIWQHYMRIFYVSPTFKFNNQMNHELVWSFDMQESNKGIENTYIVLPYIKNI